MKTVKICIPIYSHVTDACGKSLENLFMKASRDRGIFVLPEIYQCAYLYSSRNMFVSGGTWQLDQALRASQEFDYYWYIDSDISGFTYDMLRIMIDMQHAVTCAAYREKQRPNLYVAGNFTNEDYDCISYLEADHAKNGFIQWAGMGCCLVHRSVFKSLLFPWFSPDVVQYVKDGQVYREVIGEDVSFFRRLLKETDFRPWLTIDFPLEHKSDEKR